MRRTHRWLDDTSIVASTGMILPRCGNAYWGTFLASGLSVSSSGSSAAAGAGDDATADVTAGATAGATASLGSDLLAEEALQRQQEAEALTLAEQRQIGLAEAVELTAIARLRERQAAAMGDEAMVTRFGGGK